MKTKKEKPTFLVILTIIFLLQFIILPPFFRAFFPKQVEEAKKDELNILSCNYSSNTEKYNIKVNIKYKNSIVYNTKITYSLLNEDNNNINSQVNDSYISIKEQMTYFQKLEGNIISYQDNGDIIIEINDKIFELNNNDEFIKNYYNSINLENNFFTNQGYTCNIISS